MEASMFSYEDFRLVMEYAHYSNLNPMGSEKEFVKTVTIKDAARLTAQNKKISILDSIKELKKIDNLCELNSRKQELENIAFSPKISNLDIYYDTYFDPMKGCLCRELKLESLQTYLESMYPKETFLCVKEKFKDSILSDLSDLLKTNHDKPVYILFEFSHVKYKMLMVFQFKNQKYHLSVISSIGISTSKEKPPYTDFLIGISEDFHHYFKIPGLIYHDFSIKRQKDQRNCSAMIIDDMRIIKGLIERNEDLFHRENDRLVLNTEFLKTCRAGLGHMFDLNVSYIENKYICPVSAANSSTANAKATFLSLKILKHHIKNVAEFKPATYLSFDECR